MAKKKAVKTPSPAPTPTSTPKPTPTPTPTPAQKPTPTPTPEPTPKAVKTPEPAPTPTPTPVPTPLPMSDSASVRAKRLRELEDEQRKLLEEEASEAITQLPTVVAWIERNMAHFGDNQVRQLRVAIGGTAKPFTPSEAPTGKRGRPKGSKNAAKKVAKSGRGTNPIPKFRLPDGTEWNGKGRAPSSEFTTWSMSAAGKDWAKKNTTGFDWPLNPEWAKANAGKVKAQAKKAGKTVAKPAAKKVAKTPAKKASKTRAKKSAKRSAK